MMDTACAATAAPASEPFTPCFIWVIRAAREASTALAYGVIWRYAQMCTGCCFASCTRLAAHLGWTRQRPMRHIGLLLSHGLVRCLNPDAEGVPRVYVPVAQEEGKAAHDDGPPDPHGARPFQDASCNEGPLPDDPPCWTRMPCPWREGVLLRHVTATCHVVPHKEYHQENQ